eukprot:Blabericola_migrator_1__12080@NODE_743_length_6671_cov_113_057692_g533_i0_p2_GENE_NODE_743_length_6671_cov_113_057692_g533_i0NODE_743_length_6671_cov_113_057692_g533_i0_p2_ORF_typecomplete_len340_score46_62Rootletin/PF15035_6/0_012_NODE_743_length_6671_cov_113_057692_g533_i047935812
MSAAVLAVKQYCSHVVLHLDKLQSTQLTTKESSDFADCQMAVSQVSLKRRPIQKKRPMTTTTQSLLRLSQQRPEYIVSPPLTRCSSPVDVGSTSPSVSILSNPPEQAWITKLGELQHKQNYLLREENELLRKELARVRALVERKTQQVKSLTKSFNLLGEVIQDNLAHLPPEASERFVKAMVNTLHIKMPRGEPICERSPKADRREEYQKRFRSERSQGEIVSTTSKVKTRKPPVTQTIHDKASVESSKSSSSRLPPKLATTKPSQTAKDREVLPSIAANRDHANVCSHSITDHSTTASTISTNVPKVPKLSLNEVPPSAWLSGEMTAGETYTSLLSST